MRPTYISSTTRTAKPMSFAQSLILHFIMPAISAYIFLIVIYVIMGWLASFGVVNMRNPSVRQIYTVLERVAGFVLRPIQQILPAFGGLDFSPVVAILGLSWFNNYVIFQKLLPLF